MKNRSIIIGVMCLLSALAGCVRPDALTGGRWIDLTHVYDENTVYWPTAQGFRIESEFDGVTDKGYYYHANRYSASEHGGTHIDAPIHFCRTGRKLDEIPIEQLMGPAAVVDVSAKALQDRDYQVTADDLHRWESTHGRIPDDCILLLRTGFGRHWPDLKLYLGTDRKGPEAITELHFPGLHPDAARWLVDNRRIKLIGLDTASIDYGQSTHFESHQILFAADIPALENVAHLDQLPPKGAWLAALPMKIKGGSGGPVRIVARLPQ